MKRKNVYLISDATPINQQSKRKEHVYLQQKCTIHDAPL
jgi:hypothetical protein